MRSRFLFLSGWSDDRTDDAIDRLGPIAARHLMIGRDTLILSTDALVQPLPAIDGCLIGALYDGTGRAIVADIPRARQLAIMSSGGRLLVEEYSGAFIAIWRSSGDAPLHALRDPSACLPGFHHSRDGGIAIASDIEMLVGSGLVDCVPDPIGMAQYLAYPLVPSDRTCLADIYELRPGFTTPLVTPSAAVAVWTPAEIIARRRGALDNLASVIDDVVEGQGTGCARPALELSGGLDSSILAAALAPHRPAVALHMVPAVQDADERDFARLVTERFAMDMQEIPIAFEDIDLRLAPSRLTARPTNVAHFHITDRKLREARIASSADRLFCGGGGDSVFGSLTSSGLVIDAWADRGFRGARAAVAELATIAEVTHWEVWSHVLKRISSWSRHRPAWPRDDNLLGPAARAAPPPDASQLGRLRPGSRAHVASVLRMQTLLDAHDRVGEDDMQFPLMAQPVLETCLSIPSWRWIAGGRDRTVARHAFADRLPTAIVQRRGKGRYDTLVLRAYARMRTMIGEGLRDGWLAAQGIIDPDAVARALDAPVTPSSTHHGRVILLWDAELWCRMILDRQGKAGPR